MRRNPHTRPGRMHQGALLNQALAERGMPQVSVLLAEDHAVGRARLTNGRIVGLVYPDSFFDRTVGSVSQDKPLRFLFIGRMGLGRDVILKKWRRNLDARVVESKWSFELANKGAFDAAYFEQMAQAEFGLCPHEPGWGATRANMWTYRFAECCMTGAIPVQFRATPLGEAFTAGFYYVWDDDAEFIYDPERAAQNRALAEERFRLP